MLVADQVHAVGRPILDPEAPSFRLKGALVALALPDRTAEQLRAERQGASHPQVVFSLPCAERRVGGIWWNKI